MCAIRSLPRKKPTFCGDFMELAGLEPATSWVRSRQCRSIREGMVEPFWTFPAARPNSFPNNLRPVFASSRDSAWRVCVERARIGFPKPTDHEPCAFSESGGVGLSALCVRPSLRMAFRYGTDLMVGQSSTACWNSAGGE
jgi:hypothetical protein